MTAKEILDMAKREIPEDLIFQDREYYQEPETIFKDTFNVKRQQLDAGKFVVNTDYILDKNLHSEVKRRNLLRYFVVLIDAKKYHLDYRAFRSELITRYRDLIDYI